MKQETPTKELLAKANMMSVHQLIGYCDQQKARLHLQPTVSTASWEGWGGGLETSEPGQGGPEAEHSQGGLHVLWWPIVE